MTNLYFNLKELMFDDHPYGDIKEIEFETLLNLTDKVDYDFVYGDSDFPEADILIIKNVSKDNLINIKNWIMFRAQELYYREQQRKIKENL